MASLWALRRILGSTSNVLDGDQQRAELEVENSKALPVSLYHKVTNPGDTPVSAAAPLPVTLVTGDIEIGAVEIKNSTDDTRATVGANGLYVDVRSMADGGNVISVDDGGSTLSIDDGGGNISIDDGGNTITVDGSVTVSSEPSGAGTITTLTSTEAAVTNASGAALATNANRKYALFINDSANTIYLMVGATAVANKGIRLNASGGSYEMSPKIGNLSTAAVNAIAGVAGPSNLLVSEGV